MLPLRMKGMFKMEEIKVQKQASNENDVSIKDTSTKRKSNQKKAIVPKDIDPNQYVVVKNGFHGRLVYKSKKTGELYIWDGFGSEQEMELRELKSAKNNSKKFFQNNWFMFEEDWIVEYLGVKQFYRNAVKIEDFDSIFEKTAEEIKAIVSGLSNGQKKSAAYRARQLILEGRIDSNKAITALEESLGVELIER